MKTRWEDFSTSTLVAIAEVCRGESGALSARIAAHAEALKSADRVDDLREFTEAVLLFTREVLAPAGQEAKL